METPVEFVFELPTTIVYEFCNSLDPKNVWEEVAIVMPGISSVDIDACRKTPKPTESLLRIWGSKGYKVVDLYKVFGQAKTILCMKMLHPFIDPQLHSMTEICSNKVHVSSPRPATNDAQSVVRNSEHTQPSTVYSKKTNSQLDPSLLFNDSDTNIGSGDIFAGLHNTPQVKYEDILLATNNFSESNVCGKGGYGVVYRGTWKHTDVAIKRIRTQTDRNGAQNKERIRQSLQELRHLSKLRHDNILSLYAFSMDAEPCLIYQYMSNGSLEDRILCRNNSSPLDWEQRLSICQGASKGLHFLHSIGSTPIIHGDVKCANILLDKHMEPKIGDFGLCRDGQVELDASEKSPMIASHIKGTLAYLPPEFTRSKILSTKLDVYSFGVVLLEVATGLRAYSDAREPHSLVSYVNKLLGDVKGSNIKSLVDKRPPVEQYDEQIFKKLLHSGIKCSVEDRKLRPSFAQIITMLIEN